MSIGCDNITQNPLAIAIFSRTFLNSHEKLGFLLLLLEQFRGIIKLATPFSRID